MSMLTESCVGSSSLRKRGPILTLCDPKWIPACAGTTKLAVALAEAGTGLDSARSQMDSRLRGNDEVSRRPGAGRGPIGVATADSARAAVQRSDRKNILDPGLRRDDDDIRWTLWLDGDDLAVFHHIDRCAVLAC